MLTSVSADIISINSGGDGSLIVNPDGYINTFFLNGNRFPVSSNVLLSSSSGLNTSGENLSVSYSSTDADEQAITNITDWRVDGTSLAVLNMPFDRRVFWADSGAVRDYSTYENNGTLGGGSLDNAPIWNSSGKVGGCYYSSNYDWINLPNDLGYKTEVSAFAWFKAVGTPLGNYHIIFGGQELEISIPHSGGAVRTGVYTSSRYVSNHGSGANDGNWHYVGFTFNGSVKKTYLDGQYVGEQPTSGSLVYSFGNRRIGRFGSSNTYYANALIDEATIFNYSLSQEQISALYEAGLAGKHPELFVSQETSEGEIWQVALTPNDVFDDGITVLSNTLTILSTTPEDPTGVTLLSLNGRNESDTNLECSGYIEDTDSSSLTVYVNWIKDDVSQFNESFSGQSNGTTFSTQLEEGNLTLGDVWKCSMRTNDGYSYSAWTDSNELEIIDITSPNVTIISPENISYSTLDIDFNVSVEENENISVCLYNLDDQGNVTMNEVNDTYWYYNPILTLGNHSVLFACNDTSGNWGYNTSNFTINDSAAIAIDLSPSLLWNVNWSLISLPADDLDAEGNNGTGNVTEYWINISAENVYVDLYVRADGNLLTASLDEIGLGNETFCVNTTNNTVPDLDRLTMSTNYTLIASDLSNGTTVYLKFYLDAPAAQAAGTYLNNLDFKAINNQSSL
ncbi:MAG: LamG domain-containing protein [Nanoarchaeota archaeon]|nr:LamG domain-containing protein [Nanoarchaeota archaeon]